MSQNRFVLFAPNLIGKMKALLPFLLPVVYANFFYRNFTETDGLKVFSNNND